MTPFDAGTIDLTRLRFSCHVNNALRQSGDTAYMLQPVAQLIALVSASWQLQPGDLIFTGTPQGVGPLVPGDRVTLACPATGAFEWIMQ